MICETFLTGKDPMIAGWTPGSSAADLRTWRGRCDESFVRACPVVPRTARMERLRGRPWSGPGRRRSLGTASIRRGACLFGYLSSRRCGPLYQRCRPGRTRNLLWSNFVAIFATEA